ncbi:response regulator transcription factor [Arthrobacter sp. B2a2-09]|uniref:response regulator transcription factor n=1 Tax=Arthrobacter sp. B2a2-09 TaxID=2952822 RepID=UPI0022CD466F|nr:response regulator transcription factor [Arthrobacter sp. B2a2-09]MCZ9884952.1 response regulator transcription factor [Arthrobacter sp. B2a2-09]
MKTNLDAGFGKASGTGDRISVLIVDDDRWTTRALLFSLSGDPKLAPLAPVHSGAEAIKVYRQFQPDVVLMDINMPPGMTGIEATAYIREINPDSRIVLLTTVSPGPGIARGLEAGASAALSKTASDNTLRKTVRQIARGDHPSLIRNLIDDIILSGDHLPDAPAAAPRLSPCELETLRLICEGHGYDEIANAQNITPWTVKTHAKHLREKLLAENLAQLVVRALQYKYVAY